MAGRSKNRLFSQFIRQLNEDLTVKTEGLTEESRLTNTSVDSKVDSAVADLISTAPETLNTLDELAAALGDDANFATTVTNSIATKANSTDLATVATSGSYNDLTNKPSIPSISGLATTSYVDTAVAGAGASLSLGTYTEDASNNITIDLSDGDIFPVDVEGAKTVTFANAPALKKFTVIANGSNSVVGGYQIKNVSGVTSATIVDEGNASANAGSSWNPDGTKLVRCIGTSYYQFALSTPYDVTTAVLEHTITNGAPYNAGISFTGWLGGGSKLALLDRSGNSRQGKITKFDTSSYGPYDIRNTSNNSDYYFFDVYWQGSDFDNPVSICVSETGHRLYLLGTRGHVAQFNTTAAFRFTTYSGGKYNVYNTKPFGTSFTNRNFAISPDGLAITIGATTYPLSTAFELSTADWNSPVERGTIGGSRFWYSTDGSRIFAESGNTISSGVVGADVVAPSIEWQNSVDQSPTLNIGSKTLIDFTTTDGGTTYQVDPTSYSGSSDQSSSGQVLAEYHAVCNGSALKDVTAQNVTAVQNLSTTYTDATGSLISGITVPSGTKKIIYQYNAMISWVDAHAISHWKLFFSTDGSTWTEVVDARRNPVSSNYADYHASLSWPFEIAADTADNDSGKLTTTDTDTYYFKWQVREYGSSNEMKLHTTQYWDGGSTDQFTVPTVSIKCIS